MADGEAGGSSSGLKRSAEDVTKTGSSAKKRKQEYLAEYLVKHKFISRSRKGPTFAYCFVCNVDLNIAHAGGR